MYAVMHTKHVISCIYIIFLYDLHTNAEYYATTGNLNLTDLWINLTEI